MVYIPWIVRDNKSSSPCAKCGELVRYAGEERRDEGLSSSMPRGQVFGEEEKEDGSGGSVSFV